jgi:hypothetical protein
MLLQILTRQKLPKWKLSGKSVNTNIHAKREGTLFSVISNTSQFDKHDFFEHNSFVSAVELSLPLISTNQNDKYYYW